MPYSREEVYREVVVQPVRSERRPRSWSLLNYDHSSGPVPCAKLHAHHSEGPDAIMRGILTITDAAAFTAFTGPRYWTAPGLWATGCYSYGQPEVG